MMNRMTNGESVSSRTPMWAGLIALACALAVSFVVLLPGAGKMQQESVSVDEHTEPRIASVPSNPGAYVPGELIVGLADSSADAQQATEEAVEAIEALGFGPVETLLKPSEGFGAMLLVSTDDSHMVGDALAEGAQLVADVAGIGFVQPNFRCSSADAESTAVARDQNVSQQYYLDSWNDSKGANVAAAWGIAADPSTKVDVAVLDTGVYMMNEYDENDALVTDNPDNYHQEFDAENLDIADARDFVHADENGPLPLMNESNPLGDDNGHGTHVAAIIAANAQTDRTPDKDAYGMAGVSPNARVIPLKVLDSGGEGTTSDFIRAIDYLLNGSFPNLHVINMSISLTFAEDEDDDAGSSGEAYDMVEGQDSDDGVEGGSGESTEEENTGLREAIKRAVAKDIAVVCAAGNEASSGLTEPSDFPECISVVALGTDGKTADYSNKNAHKDISAPGSGIYSAWGMQGDAYAAMDGTSQATAIVSGVLSMMWAANPSLTVAGAKGALYATTHEVADPQDASSGTKLTAAGSLAALESAGGSHGAIDAAAALDAVKNGTYADWDSSTDEALWEAAKMAEDESGESGSGGGNGESGDSGGGSSSEDPDPAPISLAGAKVTLAKASYTYTGKALKPKATVVVGGETLVAGADYTVKYAANTNAGTATVTVSGKGDYTGTKKATFRILKASISGARATLAKTKLAYTGKALNPAVTVVLSGRKLTKGKDFTVSAKSNRNIGVATLTVTAKGNYKGSKKLTFTITPPKASLASVKPAKGALAAKAKAAKGGVAYQFSYRLGKGKWVNKVSKKTTLTVKKLKSGKKYTVRVRAYKKVGGKTYYGAWSASKTVKVK